MLPSRNRATAARTASRAVFGLEHGGVAGFLEDLPHQPVYAGEAQLDDDRAVAPLLDDRLASRAQRARSGETHTRALREASTSRFAASRRPRPRDRPPAGARTSRRRRSRT